MAPGLAAVGGIGMAGGERGGSDLSRRRGGIARLGFTRCIIPRSGTEAMEAPNGLELIRVRNVREAIEFAL